MYVWIMVLRKTVAENKSGFYERAPVAFHGSDNPGAAAG